MKLQDLRNKIDAIDMEIAKLLSARIKVVEAIGEEKKRLGIAIIARDRERAVLQNITNIAKQQGLNQAETQAVAAVYEKIMEESIKLEHD